MSEKEIYECSVCGYLGEKHDWNIIRKRKIRCPVCEYKIKILKSEYEKRFFYFKIKSLIIGLTIFFCWIFWIYAAFENRTILTWFGIYFDVDFGTEEYWNIFWSLTYLYFAIIVIFGYIWISIIGSRSLF